MATKQKKRADNIATRNERRNDKRKGIKPKTKARPGFEGKRLERAGQGTYGQIKAAPLVLSLIVLLPISSIIDYHPGVLWL